MYQDLADEAMQQPAEQSAALCGRLQEELSRALEGMSLYELALPATRMLLADHKCLIVSLQQLSQPPEARGTTLDDLMWGDGLKALSETLQCLLKMPKQEAQQAVISAPAEPAEPVDLMPPRTEGGGARLQPDISGMNLLKQLGMPDAAAARASLKLSEQDLRNVTTALLPQFGAQLQAYICCELGSDSLICAQLQELPPVFPRWGKFNASADPAKSFIETTNALGKPAWSGVNIASVDGQDGGQQVGGWSFMDENFFYGHDGRQVTEGGHGQVTRCNQS